MRLQKYVIGEGLILSEIVENNMALDQIKRFIESGWPYPLPMLLFKNISFEYLVSTTICGILG